MNLKGNVVLVTGGAKRVGRAIALELARAGCDVAVHYRNSPKQAEEVVNQIVSMGQKAAAIPGDLNASADWPKVIDQTIDQLGRLDVLINNAAAFTADGEEFAPRVLGRDTPDEPHCPNGSGRAQSTPSCSTRSRRDC